MDAIRSGRAGQTRNAMTTPQRRRQAGILCWAALAVSAADAQSASAPAGGFATLIDPSFGFELRLPTAWSVDRTRFQEGRGSIGVLRARSPTGQHSAKIIVYRLIDAQPFDEWMVDFAKRVVAENGGAPAEAAPRTISGRSGAAFFSKPKLGGSTALSCYLCLSFDPTTIWMLSYIAAAPTAADEQRVREEFDALCASVRVHYDAADAERFAAALERGTALLRRLRKAADKIQPDATERHYEIRVGGQPTGFMTRQFFEDEQSVDQPLRDDAAPAAAARRGAKPKRGLRLKERVWRFALDGTTRYSRIDAFVSHDLQSELIQTRESQFTAPDISPPEVFTKTDRCIREEQTMFSSFRTSLDKDLPDPQKPLNVGPAYMSLVWARLAPGLLVDAPEEPHAVVVYDAATRALSAMIITPRGEAASGGDEFAFDMREGFIGSSTRITADARGNLQRLKIGELEIVATSAEESEQRFGAQRRAALARLKSAE